LGFADGHVEWRPREEYQPHWKELDNPDRWGIKVRLSDPEVDMYSN